MGSREQPHDGDDNASWPTVLRKEAGPSLKKSPREILLESARGGGHRQTRAVDARMLSPNLGIRCARLAWYAKCTTTVRADAGVEPPTSETFIPSHT